MENPQLITHLHQRFLKNMHRHKDIIWEQVQSKLDENPALIQTLDWMETTGGEPDVVCWIEGSTDFCFCDCSVETPKGRRSLCYDQKALEERKNYPPQDSADRLATEMGLELMTETEYFQLQSFGDFDLKTSSWLKTPADIRSLGGAIFGDKRFGRVFIYHNGADSYYGARGFRGVLRF
jgi:hypothetical protein